MKQRYLVTLWAAILVGTLAAPLLLVRSARAATTTTYKSISAEAINAGEIDVAVDLGGGSAVVIPLTDTNPFDSNLSFKFHGTPSCNGELKLFSKRSSATDSAEKKIVDDYKKVLDDFDHKRQNMDQLINAATLARQKDIQLLQDGAISGVDIDVQIGGGACQGLGSGGPIAVKIQNAQNLLKQFKYLEQGLIGRIDNDDSWRFSKDPTNDGFMNRASEDGQQCQDFIVDNTVGPVPAGQAHVFSSASLYEIEPGTPDKYTPDIVKTRAPGCKLAHSNPLTQLAKGTQYLGVDFAIDSNSPISIIGFNIDTKDAALPPGSSGISGSGNDNIKVDCPIAVFSPLNWLMCPLVTLFTDIVNHLDAQIRSFLEVPTNYFNHDPGNDTGIAFYQAWASIRLIAMILLVLIGLVMVMSQILSIGAFDAYTIKKVLPRLVLAVIFIAVSWPVMEWLVRLTNDLGTAIRGIIAAPFNTPAFHNPNLGASALAVGGVAIGGVGFALGILGTLSFVATAALGVLIAFGVLLLRQIVIIMLAILAPLAIVFFILPNTQKFWKLWWESFIKGLFMFPIISAFIASGRVFAKVTNQTDKVFVHQIVAFIAYFLPYFMLPAAFRLAGGALATIGGFANDRGRGAFDRLKKFRQGQVSKNWEANKAGKRFKGGTDKNFRGRVLNRAFQNTTLLGQAGLRPSKWRDNINAAREARISPLAAEAAEKSAAARAVLSVDDLMQAALHNNGTEQDAREYLSRLGQTGNELNRNVALIKQARRDVGFQAFQEAAAIANAGTGTGYGSGPAEMLETINRVAGGDRTRAARILAGARSQAERARRVDLYGSGFANTADIMGQLYDPNSGMTAEEANERLTDEALRVKGAGEVGSARHNALTNMTGAIQRRLARAQVQVNAAVAGGTPDQVEMAMHVQKQALAHTAALQDYANAYSPENAQVVGGLMGQQMLVDNYVQVPVIDRDGNPAIDRSTNTPVMRWAIDTANPTRVGTVAERIEQLRSDPEFQQYRREYGSATSAAAASAAGGAVGAPGAPGGPTPTGGTAAGTNSDRRLKTDISYLKTLDNGIKLYSFRYIWGGPTYVGVMAQDLIDSHPHALNKDKWGYYLVDYSQLGLEMITLQQWRDAYQTQETTR